MEKVSISWTCESCHEENVTVAWRTRDTDDLEPVTIRAKCPICGVVLPRADARQGVPSPMPLRGLNQISCPLAGSRQCV